MCFLVYHVKPLPDLENSANIASAYVSCWVEAVSLAKAKKIAKGKNRLAKWEVLEAEDAYKIKEEYYSNDSNGLEFYKQALVDKWVLRFHTYPIE